MEQVAREYHTSADQILSDALRRYLWELDRRKISEESAIYRHKHAELKAQYLGLFIAMQNGQVVDTDADFQALQHRVRQRFGNTPVMMTRVEETADTQWTRLGFRLEGE
jgi:hypothetical protein